VNQAWDIPQAASSMAERRPQLILATKNWLSAWTAVHVCGGGNAERQSRALAPMLAAWPCGATDSSSAARGPASFPQMPWTRGNLTLGRWLRNLAFALEASPCPRPVIRETS
jgi:hypothetical protein